jgi:TP901 family phage tail tape measure protein
LQHLEGGCVAIANPYGDDVNKAAAAVEALNKRIEASEKNLKDLGVEASRLGSALKVPVPNEPIIDPASTKTLVQETQAHRSLTEAIRRHEIARQKLADARKRAKAAPNDDALQAEIGHLRRQATQLNRDVALKQQTLANISVDPDAAAAFAKAKRVELRTEVRDLLAAEREKTRVVQEEERKRAASTQQYAKPIGPERRPRSEPAYNPAFLNERTRLEREAAQKAAWDKEMDRFIERQRTSRATPNQYAQPIGPSRLADPFPDLLRAVENLRPLLAPPPALDVPRNFQANLARSMEAAFRQSFGQVWEPPPEHVRERQRVRGADRPRPGDAFDDLLRAIERLRGPLAADQAFRQSITDFGPGEGSRILAERIGPQLDARAANERADAERRLQALRGGTTQAQAAQFLSTRLQVAEQARLTRGAFEEARAQRRVTQELEEQENRRRALVELEETPIRERFGDQYQALRDRLAQPPPPPPPPPPPTAPPPPPPPPGENLRAYQYPPGGSQFLTPGGAATFFGSQAEQFPGKDQAAKLAAAADEAGRYTGVISASVDVLENQRAAMAKANLEAARAVTQFGAYSQAMRRHGAATTEFLTAFAQGRTTISELGWQAGATAGKFAAWTAASVGVYGAIGALAEVGRGAIDSMSGVNELSRFITDLDTSQAQQQFRELSREFNLPIEDVTIAFANMGRVFNDQNDALEGARAALLAARVGELEVADSTRFLSAIIQGFRLEATELPTVIDQINNAQNRFNFSIRDGAAGIARAAGSWRAAGGSFSDLLAIMTTAQRSTGASGEVVGTAFRRSAEFIGREANQAKLRSFGIDPTRGIDKVYEQAFAAVQSGRVQGQDVTRLATALASPQLAAVIGPTLQNFELYQKALRDTSEAESRGSARRELATQLDSIRERLREVGTELQQLGSNLGQSGFLAGLQLALETVTQLLRATNNVLGIFNELPTPLRLALASFLQMYAVMRLMRRLNVGQALVAAGEASPNTFRGRGFRDLGALVAGDPRRIALRQIDTDLKTDIDYLRQERDALARQAAAEGRDARRARQAVSSFPAFVPDPGKSTLKNRQAEIDHEKQRLALAKQATEAERRLVGTKQATAAANDDIIIRERQREEIQRAARRNAEEGLATARRYGAETTMPIAGYTPTFERPTETPIVPIPGGERATADATRRARTIAAEMDEGFDQAIVPIERATRNVETGARRAGGLFGRAGTAMKTIGTGILGLGRSLAGMIGPLGALFLGLSFAPQIIDTIKERSRRSRERLSTLQDPTAVLDEESRRRQLELATPIAERRLQAERELQADLGRPGGQLSPRYNRTEAEEAAISVYQREQERRRQQAEAIRAQQEARRLGTPIPAIPFQPIEQIRDSLAPALQGLARSHNAAGEAAVLFRRYSESIQRSDIGELSRASDVEIIGTATREELIKRARAAGATLPDRASAGEAAAAIREIAKQQVDRELRALGESVSGFLSVEDLSLLDIDRPYAEIATELAQEAQTIAAFGVSKQRLQKVATLFGQASLHLAGRTDPDGLKAMLENRKAFEDTLAAVVNETLTAVEGATTPAGRTLLAERGDRALGAVLEPLLNQQVAAREAVTAAQDDLAAAQRAAAEARDTAARLGRGRRAFGSDALTGATAIGAGGTGEAAARANLAAAEAALRTVQNQERAANSAVRLGLRMVRSARAQLALGLLAETTALIDAQTGLAVAQAGNNPVAQANARAEGAERKAAAIRKRLRRPSLRGNKQVEAQLINAETERISANNDLAAANQQAADDAERKREEAAREAERAAEEAARAAEEARQKRRETIASIFNLRKSRTDDPVRQARLEEQEARRLAREPGDANERRDDRARINEARRAREEAERNEQLETLNFRHDIGRLTDEAWIAAQKKILAGMKKGTHAYREMFRQIKRAEHDLKEQAGEGDFNVNVGNIKLPTLYEIRRAVQGGAAHSTQVSTVNTRAEIHVHGVQDPDAVAQTVVTRLDRTNRTAGRAAARARNLR